jgi:hypothetical protein
LVWKRNAVTSKRNGGIVIAQKLRWIQYEYFLKDLEKWNLDLKREEILDDLLK